MKKSIFLIIIFSIVFVESKWYQQGGDSHASFRSSYKSKSQKSWTKRFGRDVSIGYPIYPVLDDKNGKFYQSILFDETPILVELDAETGELIRNSTNGHFTDGKGTLTKDCDYVMQGSLSDGVGMMSVVDGNIKWKYVDSNFGTSELNFLFEKDGEEYVAFFRHLADYVYEMYVIKYPGDKPLYDPLWFEGKGLFPSLRDPAVDSQYMFMTNNSNSLLKIDLMNGNTVAHAKLSLFEHLSFSKPVVAENTVYFMSDSQNYLYSLTKSRLATNWKVSPVDYDYTCNQPALSNNEKYLYMACSFAFDAQILKIDAKTGKVLANVPGKGSFNTDYNIAVLSGEDRFAAFSFDLDVNHIHIISNGELEKTLDYEGDDGVFVVDESDCLYWCAQLQGDSGFTCNKECM